MTIKAKSSDIKILKGHEAEHAILQYLKRMNRPFGAVDVSANLKGAVPKATTQKILASLAEKGEVMQKAYGKMNFFAANQANINSVPAEELTKFEFECKAIEGSNNALAAEVRAITAELTKLKNCPTDKELDSQIVVTKDAIAQLNARLVPLRSGAPLISTEEFSKVDVDWAKWRADWIYRRKVFMTFWQLATDSLPTQDAETLIENLGIEFDTTEHKALEKGPLCAMQVTDARSSLKRKRE